MLKVELAENNLLQNNIKNNYLIIDMAEYKNVEKPFLEKLWNTCFIATGLSLL